MANVVQFKVSGLSELQDKLDHLPIKVSRTILRRSLKEAAKIWLDEMKLRVHQAIHHFPDHHTEFGVIFKNIIMRVSARSDLSGSARVGVDSKAFYASWIEFGIAVRAKGRRTGSGKHARHATNATDTLPAFPYARPTFEAKKQEVLDKFVEDVKLALNEEGLKLE